jgi:hypothetical protein
VDILSQILYDKTVDVGKKCLMQGYHEIQDKKADEKTALMQLYAIQRC